MPKTAGQDVGASRLGSALDKSGNRMEVQVLDNNRLAQVGTLEIAPMEMSGERDAARLGRQIAGSVYGGIGK